MRQQQLIEKRLGELTEEEEPVPGPSSSAVATTTTTAGYDLYYWHIQYLDQFFHR